MSLYAGIDEKKTLLNTFVEYYETQSCEHKKEMEKLSSTIISLEEQLKLQTAQNRVQTDEIKNYEVNLLF